MALYEFKCSECENVEQFRKSIKEGPPKKVICKCGNEMCQNFCTNFVLKGNGWPGKELKKANYESGKSIEKINHDYDEMNRDKRIVNEVTAIRRKGRKARDQFVKDHPQKWKDYIDAVKKGTQPSDRKVLKVNTKEKL